MVLSLHDAYKIVELIEPKEAWCQLLRSRWTHRSFQQRASSRDKDEENQEEDNAHLLIHINACCVCLSCLPCWLKCICFSGSIRTCHSYEFNLHACTTWKTTKWSLFCKRGLPYQYICFWDTLNYILEKSKVEFNR
jgi:hypothetical protein